MRYGAVTGYLTETLDGHFVGATGPNMHVKDAAPRDIMLHSRNGPQPADHYFGLTLVGGSAPSTPSISLQGKWITRIFT